MRIIVTLTELQKSIVTVQNIQMNRLMKGYTMNGCIIRSIIIFQMRRGRRRRAIMIAIHSLTLWEAINIHVIKSSGIGTMKFQMCLKLRFH